MQILYVATKYDYGKPDQGFSFEHCNFFDALRCLGFDILYFDYMSLLRKHGRTGMNQRLREVVDAEKPGLMFTVLATDELDQNVIREISSNTDTVTLNWFCDDHWRFDDYSRHWAPCFNWVVTTAVSALPKYEKIGYRHAIKSQWACNHFLYRNHGLPLQYDVTFVGQPHGNRRELIQHLQAVGIKVRVWGTGWDSGRLSQEEMIKVFGQSRINLNLSNSVIKIESRSEHLANTGKRLVSRSLDAVPGGERLKSVAKRALLKSSQISASAPIVRIRTPASRTLYVDQIKGRNFEVPGCGGFMLTGRPENLEEYYDIGNEIVCYENTEDLIEKIRYFLDHEKERSDIALAGYHRTIREHTYAQRFTKIFAEMELPSVCLTSGDGKSLVSQVEEIS